MLQNSIASDTTVLNFLKASYPTITRWDWEPGLNAVSQAGGNSMMLYDRNGMKQRAVFPMMMRAMPVEQRALNFEINFELRYGGVMMPRPRSVLRLDGV